jgi:hypothetical protein
MADDELEMIVDSLSMLPVPMPRSGGSMIAAQAGERALLVNNELTIKQARENVAELFGRPESRFPTHANGVTITSTDMPASGQSMWIEGEGELIFAVNEDLRLCDSEPHAAAELGRVTSAPVEAHRAS